MNKPSFLLYKDFVNQMEMLSVEQAGHFIKAVFAYQNDREYICDDPIVNFALKGVLSQFKRDDKSYKKTCEKNRQNAKKRWDSTVNEELPPDASASDRKRVDAKHADIDSDSDTDIESDKKESKKAIASRICAFYNSHRGLMQECQRITPKRVSAINARIGEYGEDDVYSVILKAEKSNFLQGKTDACFKCGVDWIMNPNNYTKIVEGNYDNKDKPSQSSLKMETY